MRRRALLEDASRRPAAKRHQARRVADRMSATDSRPWTACLSAAVQRWSGRRAAAGSDALRRFSRFNVNSDGPIISYKCSPVYGTVNHSVQSSIERRTQVQTRLLRACSSAKQPERNEQTKNGHPASCNRHAAVLGPDPHFHCLYKK